MAHPSDRGLGLDIVRAMAISLVLLCHCGAIFLIWFGLRLPDRIAVSGFWGVELFFVLSGFLIGGILIDIAARGGATPRGWLVFMIRRWLRTLPLYLFWMLVLAIVWPPVNQATGKSELWKTLPWFLTQTQNLGWGMVRNWYDVSWSLTVEEWFYLSFSILFFLAARAPRAWRAPQACIALFIIVPAGLRWIEGPAVSWAHVIQAAVIFRIDAIAFGVAAAWAMRHVAWLPNLRWPLLGLGVLVVALTWADVLLAPFPAHIRETVIFDAASLGFALCMPAAAAMTVSGFAWLKAAMRAISEHAYSLYISHLSMLEFFNLAKYRYSLDPAMMVVLCALSIVLVSMLLTRLIERPIMRRRPGQPMAPPGGAAAGVRAGVRAATAT